MPTKTTRNLVLVLGDQLDHAAAAFDGFDPDRDVVWMAEVDEEATHVWCHKLRLALFFSAMRHFRDELCDKGREVRYHALRPDPAHDRGRSFAEVLARDLRELKPKRMIVTEPGDFRVRGQLRDAADEGAIPLEIRTDRHFFCTLDEFNAWAEGRKSLVLEHFYRHMRREHDILLDGQDNPAGGEWNYDKDNRESLTKEGPPELHRKDPRRSQLDETDREIIELVETRFADHPGNLDHLDVPRNRKQALALLRDFIKHRLPEFGTYEDAMWAGEPFLWHSRLSTALNLKLLNPRECVDAAVAAYEAGDAPINSVEGFVRQVLGWREFVRGVYWREMPSYADRNALECDDLGVPACFWDGDIDMACVRDAMRSVLDHGYSHHIVRLMVLGQLSLLLGVHPCRFHEWHMAMYLDAIDWVSLPNTLGMSQFGDGGIVGTKPYCASGKYINRMSNHCRGCKYNPDLATGDDACPFTTLYWDFLARHRPRFESNPRMVMQVRNLARKSPGETREIRERAAAIRERLAGANPA